MQDRKGAGPHLSAVPGGGEGRPTKGALVANRLRDEVVNEPGLGECSQLCDVNQMEHVCSLVVEAFAAARHGSSSGLSRPLNTLLLEPLRRFLLTLGTPRRKGRNRGDRTELQPTRDLIAAAEEVIRRIDAGPWDESRAAESATRLRYAWAIWIAYIASYWMTFEVPLRLVEKEVRREQGRLGGRTPKRGTQRSTGKAAEIVAKYIDLAARMDADKVAGATARHLEVTATYVRRVWKDHYKIENTKQQASL